MFSGPVLELFGGRQGEGGGRCLFQAGCRSSLNGQCDKCFHFTIGQIKALDTGLTHVNLPQLEVEFCS